MGGGPGDGLDGVGLVYEVRVASETVLVSSLTLNDNWLTYCSTQFEAIASCLHTGSRNVSNPMLFI